MTDDECEVIDFTVELWNKILELPKMNGSELKELENAIHNIQSRIMSRPVRREIND